MKNRHLAALLFGEPLAIEPTKLDTILRALGERLDLDVQQAAQPTLTFPTQRKAYSVSNGVAVLDVFGTLSQRSMPGVDALSGLTSYAQLAAELKNAVEDDAVSCIVLRVDSAGGEAAGVFDLADQIRSADAVKPVYAIAEDKALSAGYLIASAARELYVTQNGALGSIGVVQAVVDESMANAAQGRRVTLISAGDRKLDGNPAVPLEPEAKAAIKDRVMQTYDLFAAKVADFRGMTQAAVKDQEAAIYQGTKAVAAGLADGVSSFAALMSKLTAAAADTSAADDEDDGAGMVLARSTAPRGARMEVAMGDPKKTPAEGGDGGGQVVSLAEAMKMIEAERAKTASAEARAQALEAQAELSKASADATTKSTILKKHQDRGALVPAMLPAAKKLAEVMSADELDKHLATFPVHPILATTQAVVVPGAGIEEKAGGDKSFELDAEAKALARQFGWSEKELAAYAGISKVKVGEDGAKAVMKDGSRVFLKDILSAAGRS